MKKIILTLWAFAMTQTYAMPCPLPTQHPEGAEVYRTCGMYGVFKKDGKYGFLDTHSGEVLAEAQFDQVQGGYIAPDFTPVRQGDKWAYVDMNGQALTPYQYEYAEHFITDATLATVRKDGLYGLINKQFDIAVPLEYQHIGDFMRPDGSQTYIAVACKDGKCGYLNAKGETAIALQYDDANDFAAPVTAVKKGDKWGYIDPQGNIVQPFVYEEAGSFSRLWRDRGPVVTACVVAQRDGKRVVIDTRGKILPKNTDCSPLPPPAL